MQIHPMRSKEDFNTAWEKKMRGYGEEKKYQTDVWGLLNRDELYAKLLELSTSRVMNDLSNYRVWWDHLFLY
jgi:hypothetical protein